MKKCKDIEKLLPLYPNDLRSPDEAEMIRRHLASCAACAEKSAALEKTKKLVSDLGELAPPPRLRQKIMAAVREEAAKKSVWEKLFYPLRVKIPVQIAAALVVAVFALYVYRTGEDTLQKAASPPAPVVQKRQEFFLPQPSETSPKDSLSQNNRKIPSPASLPEGKRSAAAETAEVFGKQTEGGSHPELLAHQPAAEGRVSSKSEVKREESAPALDAVSKTQRPMDLSGRAQKPDILLGVADLERSAADVEKILVRLGARNIVRRTTGGEILIFAEMKKQDMKDLMARLKLIGRVEVNESFVGRTGGDISVAVGIFRE